MIAPRELQAQRARTDFEFAIGEDLWKLLAREDINDVNIRPDGNVIYLSPNGREKAHFGVDRDESESMARAILQCQRPVPEMNDEQQAIDCKMQLSDGVHFARVHIDSPPSVSPGFQICIRKQLAAAPTFEKGWIEPGLMDAAYLDIFRWTVETRRNIIFCGKMFSGKTTLRNSYFELMHRLDPKRGVVDIMDVDETVGLHDDFVKLFITRTRSAADHCKSFVRMSSECVGINELRGGDEAYQLTHNLWLSGHNGSSTTMHVEDPDEAIWRMSAMIAETGRVAQPDAIARAVNVLVFLRFAPEVGRRVTEIVHLKGVGSDGHVKYEQLGPKFDWPQDLDSKQYRPRLQGAA